MRRTPPVVVQLQPQWPVQAVVAGMAVLATAGLAAWAVSHRDAFWPALLAVPVCAVCAWRAAAVLPLDRRQQAASWSALRATLFSAPAAVPR